MLMRLANSINATKAAPPLQRARDWVYDTVSIEESVRMRRSKRFNSADLVARCEGTIDACIRINASQCVQVPLRLFTTSRVARRTRALKYAQRHDLENFRVVGARAKGYASSDAEVREVTDHPVLDLINKPSVYYTGLQHDMLSFMLMQLGGTAYEYVEGDGTPVARLPLFPTWVDPQMSRANFIDGYWYRRSQEDQVFFDAAEVDQYWYGPDLTNPYVGRGPLAAITANADLASAIVAESLARMMNGARPDFAWVSRDPENPPNDEQIRAAEQRIFKFRGPKNAGRPIVVGNLEPKPLSWSYKDMEWQKLADYNDAAIGAALGVPESLRKLNDSNLAGGKMGLRQFYEMTIQPMLIQYAEQLTAKLLPRFGLEPGAYYFAYDKASPEDREADSRVHVAYVGSKVLTINEVRAELGYEAVEWGDKPNEPQAGLFGPGGGSTGVNPRLESKPDEPEETPDDEPEDEPSIKALPAPKPVVEVGKSGRWFAKGCDCASCHAGLEVKELDIAGNPYYRALLTAVGSWYATAGDKLAAAGPNAIAQHAIRDELIAVMREPLKAVFEQGVASVYGEAGTANPSTLTSAALAELDQYVIRLADEITETARADLTDAIRNAVSQGMNVSEATREVASALGEQAGWRAERIARTEIARAQDHGRMETLKEVGVDRKRWLLSNAPCQFCEAAASVIQAKYPEGVPINVPFLTGGSVLIGTAGGVMTIRADVMVPSDLHPQCACAIGGVWNV